jgi:hypothetical protein
MDDQACYRPVIGGVAHLTWHRRKPPVRAIVRLLCGPIYTAGANPPTSECLACDEGFREYFDLPRRPDTPAADPSHSSATDPERGGLPQQPAGTGRAPAAPVSAGHHLECAS